MYFTNKNGGVPHQKLVLPSKNVYYVGYVGKPIKSSVDILGPVWEYGVDSRQFLSTF